MEDPDKGADWEGSEMANVRRSIRCLKCGRELTETGMGCLCRSHDLKRRRKTILLIIVTLLVVTPMVWSVMAGTINSLIALLRSFW
jgi:hypothetical protein